MTIVLLGEAQDRPALPTNRGKLIQRVLMKKARCHVYYFHDADREIVEIHSIWGARRRRGPRF